MVSLTVFFLCHFSSSLIWCRTSQQCTVHASDLIACEFVVECFILSSQVNFIFCIPHIDHGSLLLKSQKKCACIWMVLMKILSCDCPPSRAKCKQVKVKFRQFSTNLFSFFALSDFTILKCGPNLLKHIATHASPPTQPQSSSVQQTPPRSSSSVQQP